MITSVKAWINNTNNAVENGEDGMLSKSGLCIIPWFNNKLRWNKHYGSTHMALRTFAFNDRSSWFANLFPKRSCK